MTVSVVKGAGELRRTASIGGTHPEGASAPVAASSENRMAAGLTRARLTSHRPFRLERF
jgi:hypothetical protein